MSGWEVGKTCTQKGWQQDSSEPSGWQLVGGQNRSMCTQTYHLDTTVQVLGYGT